MHGRKNLKVRVKVPCH